MKVIYTCNGHTYTVIGMTKSHFIISREDGTQIPLLKEFCIPAEEGKFDEKLKKPRLIYI